MLILLLTARIVRYSTIIQRSLGAVALEKIMRIEYRDSAESKANGITYHMAHRDEWAAQKTTDAYKPSVFDDDAFIHCTDGLDLLTDIANMFYKNDSEPRTVLVLDVKAIESEVRYDDPEHRFPHIYGALNPSAVIAELPVERAEDGTFVRLGASWPDINTLA